MTFRIFNLRSDRQDDVSRTEAFLLANPSDGVRLRPHQEMMRAMGSGFALVVEQNGEICGCSLVYHYDDLHTPALYSEIGTMRITANGYDLQTFLAKLHLLQIWIQERPVDNDAVFAVVGPGTASEHNLKNKAQMAPWSPPPLLLHLRKNAGVEFLKTKLMLKAQEDAFGSARSDLAQWHKGGQKFATPKGRETVQTELGWFMPDMLKVGM